MRDYFTDSFKNAIQPAIDKLSAFYGSIDRYKLFYDDFLQNISNNSNYVMQAVSDAIKMCLSGEAEKAAETVKPYMTEAQQAEYQEIVRCPRNERLARSEKIALLGLVLSVVVPILIFFLQNYRSGKDYESQLRQAESLESIEDSLERIVDLIEENKIVVLPDNNAIFEINQITDIDAENDGTDGDDDSDSGN